MDYNLILANFAVKVFDYGMREIMMRRRIVGRTNEICLYEGIYTYEKDHTQTATMKLGDSFPAVHILPRKGEPGGGRIGPGIWILRHEHSPQRSWKEILRICCAVIVLALLMYVIRLALWGSLP